MREIMKLLIALFAIYGLAFTLSQADGPWGLLNKWRNFMMRLPLVGAQFYKLISCYFCLGFHSGWIVYLLSAEHVTWQFFTLWALAGGAFSLMMDNVLQRLQRV